MNPSGDAADTRGMTREDPSWSARLRAGPPPVLDEADVDDIDRLVDDGSSDSWPHRHARRYIASGGQDDGWDGPRPILLLYTVGRRSGLLRRTPVLYFELKGHRHVIGSRGGTDEHPAWFLNVQAEPRVHVRVMADLYAATATVLSPAQRAEVWPHLIATYPMFADYQTRTNREIPVVRLIPDAF